MVVWRPRAAAGGAGRAGGSEAAVRLVALQGHLVEEEVFLQFSDFLQKCRV